MERRDGESKTGRQRLVEEMGMVTKWKGGGQGEETGTVRVG